MRISTWSIRGKLTALLLLPLVSLAGLWTYAADLSLGNALTLAHQNTIGNRLARPVGQVVIALQSERRYAMVAAAAPDAERSGLLKSRVVTDAAVKIFLAQAHDDGVRDDENARVRRGVDATEKALSGLGQLRLDMDAKRLSSSQIFLAYNAANATIAEALHAMTVLPDESAQDFGQALYTIVPAGDLLAQEDALISAAAAGGAGHRGSHGARPRTGGLQPGDYSALVQNIGAQRHLFTQAMAKLPAPQRAPFLKLAAPGGSLAEVTAMEDQLIAAGPAAHGLPFPIERWRTAYDAQQKDTSDLALKDISVVFDLTGPPARRAFVNLILAGALGLIALIASIIMSVRISRSLVGDVAHLRTSARNLTDDQLRDAVGRLRRGETVDVQAAMEKPVFVNREMAELGASFYALQLTAVELAEEDIRLHRGISDAFLNLARRSQALVHRQLSLLDAMERREEDPAALEELFRLDQLATRMRRYAEGLIIVSGAPPGRFWHHPVPAVDVVRGAVAETEHYTRVVVLPVPEVGVVGRAAADVIHLLAELVENAESFSPSDSQVRVSAGTGASGLIIEIDDRGLGMSAEHLEAANARITSFLDVSALDSTRLGLVTVGRLAQRHDISVSLRSSPYGGVTAVVLIPHTLLEWDLPSVPDNSRATGGHISAQPQYGAGDQDDQGQPVQSTLPGTADTGAYAYPGIAPGHFAARVPVHAGEGTGAEAGALATRVPDSPPPALAAPPAAYTGLAGFPQSGPDDDPGMIDGLPRRVPQANLVEELRQEEATPGGAKLMDWAARGDTARAPVTQPAWTEWASADGMTAEAVHLAAGPEHMAAPPWDVVPARGPHGTQARPEQVRSIMTALQAGAARARLGARSTGQVPGASLDHHDYQGRDNGR